MTKIKELDSKSSYILDGEIFTFNGVEYKIHIEEDSSDEIEYFQILDDDGNFVAEMDWGGDIPGDVIAGLLGDSTQKFIFV